MSTKAIEAPSGKIGVNLLDLLGLAEVARRNGTHAALFEVMLQWADVANAEIVRLREALAELEAQGWQIAPDRVPMPQNADQAVGMVLLGTNWLENNAPERLKRPAAHGGPLLFNGLTEEETNQSASVVGLSSAQGGQGAQAQQAKGGE